MNEKQTLTFLIAALNRVRRFWLNGTRLLSNSGAKMHPFETQFSLQGASHGKSSLLVFSNGACEKTNKAYFLIGGGGVGGTRYKALIFLARRRQRRQQRRRKND